MTNPQFQQELKEKVKEGVKPSDLKKLKRSKSTDDVSVPLPPPEPDSKSPSAHQLDKIAKLEAQDTPPSPLLADQLKEKQKVIESLREKGEELNNSLSSLTKERQDSAKQVGELRAKLDVANNSLSELSTKLSTTTAELDQSLFARQQSLKQFGQIHSKLQAVKKELGENVDYASTELISQDDQISKLKGERIDFKFKIQQLEKDLSLAQRLAEMRKNPLPNYEKDLAPDFWPYLIWPLTLILIYWMLKSKHG